MKSIGFSNQFPAQAFAMFDMNSDGGLDEDERLAPLLRTYSFAEFDIDNGGRLTMEELRSGFAAREPIWHVQVHARGAESSDAIRHGGKSCGCCYSTSNIWMANYLTREPGDSPIQRDKRIAYRPRPSATGHGGIRVGQSRVEAYSHSSHDSAKLHPA